MMKLTSDIDIYFFVCHNHFFCLSLLPQTFLPLVQICFAIAPDLCFSMLVFVTRKLTHSTLIFLQLQIFLFFIYFHCVLLMFMMFATVALEARVCVFVFLALVNFCRC